MTAIDIGPSSINDHKAQGASNGLSRVKYICSSDFGLVGLTGECDF